MDQDSLDKLLKKYDRPGPRYTSYPMVPVWTENYGAGDYEQALKALAEKPDEPLSFYLHVPFCRQRCWFCGCNTTTLKNESTHEEYLRTVARECDLVVRHLGGRKKVSQIHWGGGTPSCMNSELTVRAFEIFSERFSFTDNAEISIEIDPRVTDYEKIDILHHLGFNRLSFGIQDFDKEIQHAIGRNQDQTKAVQLYSYCRQIGYTGINFDLIYGLPLQTLFRFKENIRRTIELKPDRVALYSFAYLPNSKLHQKKIDNSLLPSAGEKLQLFLTAREMFLESGYRQIGLDHFVRPSDELARAREQGKLRRNFMGYTVRAAKDWIGLGMSSISYVDDNFAQNVSDLKKYGETIEQSKFAIQRGLKLSQDDKIRQYAISQLMCNFMLDKSDLEDKFGIKFENYFEPEIIELEKFKQDNLLEERDNKLMITEAGRLFIRNIAMEFDIYLRQGDLKVQFSRTV